MILQNTKDKEKMLRSITKKVSRWATKEWPSDWRQKRCLLQLGLVTYTLGVHQTLLRLPLTHHLPPSPLPPPAKYSSKVWMGLQTHLSMAAAAPGHSQSLWPPHGSSWGSSWHLPGCPFGMGTSLELPVMSASKNSHIPGSYTQTFLAPNRLRLGP